MDDIPILYRNSQTTTTDPCPFCGKRHLHLGPDGIYDANCPRVQIHPGRQYRVVTRQKVFIKRMEREPETKRPQTTGQLRCHHRQHIEALIGSLDKMKRVLLDALWGNTSFQDALDTALMMNRVVAQKMTAFLNDEEKKGGIEQR